MINSRSLDAPVFVGPSSIVGLETRRHGRVNSSTLSVLVTRMKSLRPSQGDVSRNVAFAAEGATDVELVSMPQQTADRLLEAAKVKAYIHAGLGYK